MAIKLLYFNNLASRIKNTRLTYRAGQLSWKAENTKYTFWILGTFGVIFGLELLALILNNYSLSEFLSRKETLIGNLNILLIPFAAINVLYLAKLGFARYCQNPKQLFWLKIAGLCIGVMVGTAIVESISYAMNVRDDDYISIGHFTISEVPTNFITNVLMGLMIGVPLFSKHYQEEKMQLKLRQKEAEMDRLYQLKIESQLETINAKINPHFLYNALNSIVSLIHEDQDKAERMVLSLSDLFRYSINSDASHFSKVRDEIKLVQTYLDIEYVRFQDQLSFEIEVDQKAYDHKIPRFLIQPLIENAIKHGTSKIRHGKIKLEIVLHENDLCISVYDNGPEFPEDLNSGYGLKSTVEKLELLCKDAHSFRLINTPEKRIEICIKN